jgi:hypothetical protein
LLPQYGPAQGKGDAMWRALSVAHGDIVMFADADTRDDTAAVSAGVLAGSGYENQALDLTGEQSLSLGELAALCGAVAVPVYARSIALEQAWKLGASGINEINP